MVPFFLHQSFQKVGKKLSKFTSNFFFLIDRNPILQQMINKKNKSENRIQDPFLSDKEDFMNSKAFESEVWELESLKKFDFFV